MVRGRTRMSPPCTQPAPRANAPVLSESSDALVWVLTLPTGAKQGPVVAVQIRACVPSRRRSLCRRPTSQEHARGRRPVFLTAAQTFKRGSQHSRRPRRSDMVGLRSKLVEHPFRFARMCLRSSFRPVGGSSRTAKIVWRSPTVRWTTGERVRQAIFNCAKAPYAAAAVGVRA